MYSYEDFFMQTSESSDSEESLLEIPILPITFQEKSIQVEKRSSAGQHRREIQVYIRAYVEEYSYKDYTQIHHHLPSIDNIEISETVENKEHFKLMRDLLLPLVTTLPLNPSNVCTISSLSSTQKRKNYISSILDIAPHEGFLLPNECQLISINLCPKPNTKIKANAICHVLGGVNKEIYIEGDASAMGYELDTDYVDFGRIVSIVY